MKPLYKIFIDYNKYSPPGDKKYFENKRTFFPDWTIKDPEGGLHVWKHGDEYVRAVEIYPIQFLNYPNMEARRVQHVTVITKEEYENYLKDENTEQCEM